MKASLVIIIGLAILMLASAAKPKKNAKSEPAPAEKATIEEGTETAEDVEDILKDEEDGDEEVRIPTLDELTTESDPIELGRRIKNLTDEDKRKALTADLKKAYNKNNRRLISGKFYRAAYAALSTAKGAEEKAEKFWKRELKKALAEVMNESKNIVDQTKAGLGDALDNTVKNLGKAADLANDAIKTVTS